MYFFARFLQFAGLAILPLAMLLEFLHRITLGQYLLFTLFGATLFTFGYTLGGFAQKNDG